MVAYLLPEGRQSFETATGAPAIGWKLYTYDAGTNNPRVTWADANQTVPNTNPIVLDARGEAAIYFDGNYKLVLKDQNDVTIWTQDNVEAVPATYYLAFFSAITGASFIGADDGAGGSLFTTMQGFVNELIGSTGHLFHWGNLYGNGWDGASDFQAMFGQTQSTFLTNGSLGALYGQRIVSYTGGAPTYAQAGVSAAVRGYNQINKNAGIYNESGGLFVTDNYSNVTSGIGVAGTGFSWNGGPTWGGVFEAIEEPRLYSATAGQTIIPVDNGFTAIGAVSKNGTLLATPADYTSATPNVTLTTGAQAPTFTGSAVGGVLTVSAVSGTIAIGQKITSGPLTGAIITGGAGTTWTISSTATVSSTAMSSADQIRVYVANPSKGVSVGVEIDATVGFGTDTANVFAGNRQGLAIVGRRQNRTHNVLAHVGTMLNLYASPDDALYLIADRGINFEGQFDRGIDFAATDATFASYLMRFNAGGAGFTSANHLALGNQGNNPIAGYGSLFLAHSTNGGIIRLGDATNKGRIEASTGAGFSVGSETNIDTLLKRNGNSVLRLNGTLGANGMGLLLEAAVSSTSYANDAAAAAGGVPVGTLYRNGSVVQVRIV